MKRILLCIVLSCFVVAPAFAQLIVWNSSSITTTHGPSPWDPTSADPNLTVTGLTRGAGLTTSGTGISGNKGWGANGFNIDGTSQPDKDFSFTVKANTGYKVSLSNFKWMGYRRSNSSPNAMKVYYSINGGADVEIANWTGLTSAAFNGTTNVMPNGGDISLSGIPDLQNVPTGSTIKFRMLPSGGSISTSANFYLYYSTTAGGVLSVSGTVDVDAAPPPTNTITTTPATYGPYCVNATTATPSFNVAYTTTGTYTGNYKVQLSNAGGVFPFNATDNIIGTGTTSPISATIPAGTTTGAGYRVRVINDNPVTYGSDNGSNISVSNVVVPTVVFSGYSGISTMALCAGTTLALSSTVTNGTSPTYQWTIGSTPVGNSSSLSYSSFNNGDVLTLSVINNTTCPSMSTGTVSMTFTIIPIPNPSVSIASSTGSSTICGTSATFTATPTLGGTIPTYDWYVGSQYKGTGNPLLISGLNTGDVITTRMGNVNVQCAGVGPFISNAITVTVAPGVTPTVSIAANPGNTVCDGTPVTFTATPANGGTAPVYEWKKGTTTVGTNNVSYTDNGPVNGDVVTVNMTSNATCPTTPTVTSSPITMQVTNKITPGVTLTISPNDTICAGTTVTFTATPANGGTTPAYVWKNGTATVGANSTTYVGSLLANGDVVSVTMTSSETCVTTATATDNITMTVKPTVVPAVVVTANPGTTIAPGTSVTFTAVLTNGGSAPVYQWRKNDTDISGAQNTTYTSNTLANNDVITCVVLHDAECAANDTARSTGLTMKVSNSVATMYGAEEKIILYPNPNRGTFIVEGNIVSADNKVNIEVVNALGQVVYKDVLLVNSGVLRSQINLSAMPVGVYMLQLHTNANTSLTRFLIAHE